MEIELFADLLSVPGVEGIALLRFHSARGIVECVGPGSLIIGVFKGIESKTRNYTVFFWNSRKKHTCVGNSPFSAPALQRLSEGPIEAWAGSSTSQSRVCLRIQAP